MIEFQNVDLRRSKKRWPNRTAQIQKNCSAKQFERFGRFFSFSYRSSERKRLRHTAPEKGCFSSKRAKLFSYLHAHKIYLRLAQVTVGLRCTLCRDENKPLNKDRNNPCTYKI